MTRVLDCSSKRYNKSHPIIVLAGIKGKKNQTLNLLVTSGYTVWTLKVYSFIFASKNNFNTRLKKFTKYTFRVITSQLHCFQLRTTLNRIDFKFVSHGLWSKKQNILRQHMHKKEFWILTIKYGNKLKHEKEAEAPGLVFVFKLISTFFLTTTTTNFIKHY